ncbi:peptide ABC transporter substrate-binding protein [Ruania alkalisoli]|uniref:Peptide ABC transporter substrate-binding protein n=1 Tax=Ruania alkalisoli TaxID=2779775 RepID=A0A7M1SSA6_9MICO|nr:peptide ABC transporter substrate-binding protein [Ruania alkalisoli]QOR70341.1 peptide ABC transporter substrate-binding protein [Ruania alkalisoli]
MAVPHTMPKRSVQAVAAVAAAALALTACSIFGDGGTDASTNSGSGDESAAQILRTTWPNPESLDPHVITNGIWIDQQGLFEGLVVQNADGSDVEPGMAAEWNVSEDGTVWTFQLRGDAAWSNGEPVTAADFVWTYERLLTPGGSAAGTTTGANSYQTALGIVNASEFLAGSVTDFSEVGIEATAEHELVFTLEAPNPGFLLGLTHPSMLPLHPATLEEFPQEWTEPENWVSNGPFVLDEWQRNVEMTLVPNENYWDGENVHLDEVEIQLFASGEPVSPVAYDNDEVDLMQLVGEDVFSYVDNPEFTDQIRAVEQRNITYLALLRSTNPVLEDVRVREALSLALGREIVAGLQPGVAVARSLVPEYLGAEHGLGQDEDIARAQELLADAGYPDGEGFPELMLLTEAPRPELDVAVDQWGEHLGISARVNNVERGVYVEERWSVQESPGFYSGGFITRANWNDAINTIFNPRTMEEFSLPAEVWEEYQEVQADEDLDPGERESQLRALRDEHASAGAQEFTALAAEGSSQPDLEAATGYFVDAAEVRDDLYLYLPVTLIDANYLVRPGVEGLNLRGTPDVYYFKGVSITGE